MKIKTFQQGYKLSMNLLRKDLQLEVTNFSQKYNWGILVNQRISRLWRTGGSLKCEHYLYLHCCIPFPGGYQLNTPTLDPRRKLIIYLWKTKLEKHICSLKITELTLFGNYRFSEHTVIHIGRAYSTDLYQ